MERLRDFIITLPTNGRSLTDVHILTEEFALCSVPRFGILQGGWSFLPPPNFPMCHNPEKKQSPKLATLWNDKVQDLPPQKNGRVPNSGDIRGGKFWTLQFFGGGKSWTLSLQRVASSGFWHIGKFGGGKKDQPPCMKNCKTMTSFVALRRPKNDYLKILRMTSFRFCVVIS